MTVIRCITGENIDIALKMTGTGILSVIVVSTILGYNPAPVFAPRTTEKAFRAGEVVAGTVGTNFEIQRSSYGNCETALRARCGTHRTTGLECCHPELREVIRLVPHHAGAHFLLGDALRGAGDLDSAVAEYRASLDSI